MNKRFDAVICDIDGCLGPESTASFDIEKLLQIRKWNDRAIATGELPVLTVCSGRPLPFAEALCRVIGNTQLPAICENGVWLFDPKHHAYERDPAIDALHVHAVHETQAWIERDLMPRGFLFQPGKSASISLWHQDTERLRELCPRLVEKFAAEGWPFRVSMTVAWINCDLAFVSKSSGLRRFVEKTGLDPARLLGIGDSASDLAMKDYCSVFGAPANAAPDVLRLADFVSGGHEIDGVLDILQRLAT